jgi:hypothetical protein
MEELMRAQDLATYFVRKIAQPIPFEHLYEARGVRTQRSYMVEPIAVDDGVLYAMVTLKREIILDGYVPVRTEPVMCGEVEIPLEDDGSVTTVVVMAVADGDLREDCMNFREDDPVRIAFEELSARQADLEMRRIGIKM